MKPWKHLVSLFVLCAVFFVGCGESGYLSEAEFSRTELILQRCKDAKEKFTKPDKWTAKIVLAVLDESQSVVKNNLDKLPPDKKELIQPFEKEWRKSTMVIWPLAKRNITQIPPEQLNASLEHTIAILEKFIEIQNT